MSEDIFKYIFFTMISQDLALEIKKVIGPLNYSTWKFKIKNILLCGTLEYC
jgi:hypothetical protein